MVNKKKELKERVSKCRNKLRELEIKNPKHYFCLKYPEYKPKSNIDLKAKSKIDNLYYGNFIDEDFTIKLEAFVSFTKTHFK